MEATAGELAVGHEENKSKLLVCALIKCICPSEPLTPVKEIKSCLLGIRHDHRKDKMQTLYLQANEHG